MIGTKSNKELLSSGVFVSPCCVFIPINYYDFCLEFKQLKQLAGFGVKFNFFSHDGTTDDGTVNVQFWAIPNIYIRFGIRLLLHGAYL